MTQIETTAETLHEYLIQRLAHLPPPSTWPADEPPPAASDDTPGHVAVTVPEDVAAGLGRLADRLDVPVPAILTACLLVLLFRVRPPWDGTADDDIVIATGTSGQPGDWLPLRQSIDPAESFTDLVARLCTELHVTRALHEQSGPCRVADLALTAGVAPEDLYRAVLVLDDSGPATSAADLVLTLSPRDGYRGTLRFATAKYTPATATCVVASYLALLDGAVAAPETSVGELPVVPSDARPHPVPGDTAEWAAPAHELVARSARAHPDQPALRWHDGELSYAELDAAAERFAATLGSPRAVAVSGPRSPELVIALLATLKCGAGYVPLDPSQPQERLDHMLSDSRAEVLVCPRANASNFTLPPSVRLVELAGAADPGGDAPWRPARPTTGDDLCYVLYTSGSTGPPKAVEMPHRPLSSLLAWQARRSAATTGWRTLQFAAFSVDVAFQEIFATWHTGGTLVLVDEQTRRNPAGLLEHIADHGINRLFAPSVALQQLAETAVVTGRYPTDLREVITAGEQLQVSPAIRQFFQRTGATLENQYGLTETHVVTAERLASDPRDWPELPAIGAPIDRATVQIRDERQQPLPVGVPGEICVRGIPLAHGYVAGPELTANRFVSGTGSRVYRTGDVGRLLPDGRIQYLGRHDSQVKIRGTRIELGEIEARLKAEVGLTDAVVVVRDSPTRGKQLVAYYLLTPGFDVPPSVLRRTVSSRLPDHMVPTLFVALTGLPLTPSGKVDRHALANRPVPTDPDAAYAAVLAGAAGADQAEASTPIERVVAEVWTEALCRTSIPVATDVFAVGGDSRTAQEVSALLSDIFRVPVPVHLLFERPTIAGQAAWLTELDPSCPHSLGEIAERLLTYDVEVVGDH